MSTSFQQVDGSGPFGTYPWSSSANWTNGVPVDGAAVTVNVGPTFGYDDIASLYLDSLDFVAGNIAVGGTLTIGSLTFGSTSPNIAVDTLISGAPSTLTIDGFSGSQQGFVSASGTDAVTQVLSLTDPGEFYSVDEGGELTLAAAPNASSTFTYENDGTPQETFAFSAPGGTVASLLAGVSVGDSIALPGSFVSSVIYGTNAITITTNLGTTTFNDVTYGTKPSGYTLSTDPTGLQRITFTSQQTTSFQQVDGTGPFGTYAWSKSANWTNGVPVDGAAVTVNVGSTFGYDDIASLYLDSLDFVAGNIAVGGTLTIGSLTFGSTSPNIAVDTLISGAPSTLTIDGFSGSQHGFVSASGTDAVTKVLSLTDPGEFYHVDEGGELTMAAAPNASSTFTYDNDGPPQGIFAFSAPGATVASLLAGVSVGDSIALPGSFVSSVLYGTSAIRVTTNLGATTFNDVTYGTTKPSGYTLSTDPTGLQRITFTSQQTTSFQQVDGTGPLGTYAWSKSANWTNGVPVDGAAVTVNVGSTFGYDDIASLYLDSFDFVAGNIAVGGTLTIGSLTFGSMSPNIGVDTLITGAPATLNIDGFSRGLHGFIGASGTDAVTNVLSLPDPGEFYYVDEGGELTMAAAPNATSQFTYDNDGTPQGTFAFSAPGATVASLLAGVSVGDSIALPGSFVSSVIYGTNSITITTNLGTTIFDDVTYGTKPTDYTLSTDPTGLQRITFEGPLPCFLSGTRIATERGAIRVDDLREGEHILTHTGTSVPIRWIGRCRIDTARHPRPDSCWPIRISRHAIAPDKPRSDLLLSPDHAILLDGVLIPAKLLVNGMTIVQETRIRHVDYFHVELDHHAILLSEGLETESYLDTGNRMIFENAGLGVVLHPSFAEESRIRDWDVHACAPLGVAPEIVGPIWHRIVARATGPLGFVPPRVQGFTTDPDLHLEVGGRLLRPVVATADGCTFVLPRGATVAVLHSRAASPATLEPFHADRRTLGVAVQGLRLHLRQPGVIREIALDTPDLTNGWWAPEAANNVLWRWTDGAGVISIPPDATMLTIAIRGAHRYPIVPEQQALSGCEVAA